MSGQAASDSLSQSAISFLNYQMSWFVFSADIIYYIAVAIGFFIIFVSYFFGGGKRNKVKIIMSIIIGMVIGLLTLPLLLKISGDSNPALTAFFIFLDVAFATTVACHMYELVVIGTHEAFDTQPK